MTARLPGPVTLTKHTSGVRTCGCGVQYKADKQSPRACASCLQKRKEVKAAAQAARPWSDCRKCGTNTQDCSLLGDCRSCRAKRSEECKAERQRVYEEHQRARAAKEGEWQDRNATPLEKPDDFSYLDKGAISAQYVIRGGYPKQHNGGKA